MFNYFTCTIKDWLLNISYVSKLQQGTPKFHHLSWHTIPLKPKTLSISFKTSILIGKLFSEQKVAETNVGIFSHLIDQKLNIPDFAGHFE